MSSVITGIYKMKKRRSSAADGAIASTSAASSSSKIDANAYRPTAYCGSSSAAALRQHKFLTCDSLLVTHKVEVSPRTPRRSPRIHGAVSRTSRFACGFEQDSPESQEPLITWKCNSPVYVKTLKPISAGDLREVVRQFVPVTKPARKQPAKPSLLDLWRTPCEMPPVIPLAKPVPPSPEQSEPPAKEQEELMEQESINTHAEPIQVPTADEEKDVFSSVYQPAICVVNGNGGVWGDDALFEDENVIAATQQVELEALSHAVANHCVKPKNEQIPQNQLESEVRENNNELSVEHQYEAGSPDILDCATQILVEDSILDCATQPVSDQSDDSWSHEFMDVAFVEDVRDESVFASDASKIETTEVEKTMSSKLCAQEEIQRKREEALRRRSARLRALQPQNNTLKVVTHPVTTPFAFKNIAQNGTFSRSNSFNDVNKVNEAAPVIQPIISQGVPACSQSYTQREIQLKKEEALKRRSARLAAQTGVVHNSGQQEQRLQVTATAMATALEAQRRLYNQDEIERKKKQAIEKRLMMMQKKQQQQSQAQLTTPRHQRLVPYIN